jgi:hypothetical protein
MFGNKKKKAEKLMAEGARGVGTITGVRDTGTTINDNPRVALTFRIEPLDGSPAFDASKTKTVSRVAIPQAGSRYPILYDREEPSTFAWIEVSDDQGRQQVVAMFGDAFGADGAGVGRPGVAAAAPPPDDPIETIRKLDELRTAGVLTDDEFAAQKAKLLAEL